MFCYYRGIRDLAEGSKLYDLKRHHNMAGYKTKLGRTLHNSDVKSAFTFIFVSPYIQPFRGLRSRRRVRHAVILFHFLERQV